MYNQLGNLMASFNPGSVQSPTYPMIPDTNPSWMDKLKTFGTPAGQGGSGRLEGLVTALDMFGRGLDRAAGGKGGGFGGLEMAQSSLASKANKERQGKWGGLLQQLISGMTPKGQPGGNKMSIKPTEGGGFTVDHSLDISNEDLSDKSTSNLGLDNPVANVPETPSSFLGKDMESFPLF